MATPVGSPPIPSTAAATSAPPVDLRGLRRELASVRRSLAQARESLNNLIDDGSEDYLPVLEELHEREATSLARIAELETDIVEAQATLDASHSDRSRQAGLSRATRALGVLGEHVSGSVQQNTEPRVSPHQSVQYMSLSPSNAEDPEDPGSRVPVRPTTTLADLNRVPVPEVQSAPHVASHLILVESLFEEAGAGHSMSGYFVPYSKFKLTCFTKLATSLKPCPEALAAAHEVARTTNYSWQAIREELRQQFSRKDQLRDGYRSALSALRFADLNGADAFLRKCSALFHLYQDVYKDETFERRIMVRAVINKLPENLRLDVIESIYSSSGMSRDVEREMSEDTEWELLLPFDGVLVGPTVVGCIRKSCRIFRDASIRLTTQPSGGKSSERDGTRTLHMRAASDVVSQVRDAAPKHRRESLSKWASKFAVVYVIGGPGVQGQPDQVVRADESRVVPLRSGNGQLWFLAYRNKVEGTDAVRDLHSDQFQVRPFQFRGRLAASGAGAPQEPGN